MSPHETLAGNDGHSHQDRRPRHPGRSGLARPYHVFDNNGEVIGSFGDWDSAHAFAHTAVAVPGTATPVEVDDRRRRLTRRVWPHRCEFVAWRTARRAIDLHNHCDHPPAQ